MTILVKVFKINRDGKMIFPGLIIDKFSEEEIEFDYTKPQMWEKFIRIRYRRDLQKFGKRLRWQVYRLGGNPSYINYFPGYDTQGKHLSVKKYGRI